MESSASASIAGWSADSTGTSSRPIIPLRISPRTLSERLRALENEQLVNRRSYAEAPPRVEYDLTEKGRGLLPIVDAMRRFGRQWLAV